jgi:hypothetical protein
MRERKTDVYRPPATGNRTLLHPYLVSCPSSNPYIEFDIFPRLEILNNPDPFLTDPRPPAITHNRTSLSLPGRTVKFSFEKPGKIVGPNGDYKTITHSKSRRPKVRDFVFFLARIL